MAPDPPVPKGGNAVLMTRSVMVDVVLVFVCVAILSRLTPEEKVKILKVNVLTDFGR